MKEATGEFSMTAITIVAVAVIAGLIAWLSPKIAEYVQESWNTATNAEACPDSQYRKGNECVPY